MTNIYSFKITKHVASYSAWVNGKYYESNTINNLINLIK